MSDTSDKSGASERSETAGASERSETAGASERSETAGASDKAAWIEATVSRFERPLITYAYRLTGDLEMARDVVQDAFLRLWQADREELEGHLAPWLYRVCRNRAVDVLRKDGRMTRLDDDRLAATASPSSGPGSGRSEGAGREHDDARLAELMHGLPDRQQEILRLKFQGGLSYRQIAEVMDLTVSNVGFLIHTSIKALREQLATGGGSAGGFAGGSPGGTAAEAAR
jgi:RNA polymerase sigma-70 factor (ECF subfamily)